MYSRKNLILFLFFVSLGVFTYFFEELGQRKKYHRQLNSITALKIDLPSLTELNLPDVRLKKRGSSFFSTKLDFLVDRQIFNEFVNDLKKIHIIDDITLSMSKTLKEQVFDNKSITFSYSDKNRKTEVRIGAMVPLSDKFYLEIENGEDSQYYLCQDRSTLKASYQKNDEGRKRYSELRKKLSVREIYFLNKQIFQALDLKKMQQLSTIEIDNRRNRFFKILLKTQTTIPAAISGVFYNVSKIAQLKKLANNLYFSNIHIKRDGYEKKLKNNVSTILLDLGSKIYLKMYKRYRGVQGYFLTVTGHDFIYELFGGSSSMFFSNVQDYWMKRPHFETAIGKFDVLFEMEFAKQQRFKYLIPKGKYLTIKHASSSQNRFEIKPNSFFMVFRILFGLDEFDQAFRVSQVTRGVREGYAEKKGIDLHIAGRTFRFVRQGDEILLIDNKDGVAFHYLIAENELVLDRSFFVSTKSRGN